VEFGCALKEVTTENKLFLSLLSRVRKDLDVAYQRKREHAAGFGGSSESAAWIDDAVLDVQKALDAIGQLIESARVEIDKGGSVSWKHRVAWVLSNHQKFVTHELMLATCHRTLLSAINDLHIITTSQSGKVPSIRITPLDPEENSHAPPLLKSPSARRPKRSSPKLSEPIVTILPVDMDHFNSSQETLLEYRGNAPVVGGLERSRSVADERRRKATARFLTSTD